MPGEGAGRDHIAIPTAIPTAIPLLLFAKVPQLGRVKTRMQPHLSPAQSVTLAEQLLTESMRKIARHWPGECILAVSPATNPTLDVLCAQYHFRLAVQVGADLGERLAGLMTTEWARAGAVAVMGCDVAYFPASVLHQAHRLLAAGSAVIGPATDGGFYLLGLADSPSDLPPDSPSDWLSNLLSDLLSDLFAGIEWGESRVHATLMHNAAQRELSLHALPPLRDIDTYADLCWLATRAARYRHFIA